MRTTSSVVLRVVAVANHWIRPPLFRAASTLQPVRPLRVNLTKADSVTTEKPAWVVQRELSLRVKSLPSATDVLLEVKSWTGDTHNLRNLVTALHAVCGKVRARVLLLM